jgi:hypothetical protein
MLVEKARAMGSGFFCIAAHAGLTNVPSQSSHRGFMNIPPCEQCDTAVERYFTLFDSKPGEDPCK